MGLGTSGHRGESAAGPPRVRMERGRQGGGSPKASQQSLLGLVSFCEQCSELIKAVNECKHPSIMEWE